MSEKGDKRALECLATCFADADRMVRQVALEASEQLLDKSLTSVLLVLGVLRNVCEVFFIRAELSVLPGLEGRDIMSASSCNSKRLAIR